MMDEQPNVLEETSKDDVKKEEGTEEVPPPEELNTEELRKEAQEIFDFLDADKNGYIDAKEVGTFFRECNTEDYVYFDEDTIKEYIAEFLEKADADNDAKVTFDELYNALLKERTNQPQT